ncbi:MAG TPA: helix-turn-helix transcriptional regulator [Streptosporangiaceae bacterium]|nr:helix-turn-helix transcriptional regulator [Streptosporangiaceae bacterium]
MTDLAGGPTILRLLLGAQLRRLREAREISAAEAARAIRGSESKISRIELGRTAVREIDIADLLTLYGISEQAEREALLSLASRANQPGWWHRYSDVLPPWSQSYIGLEGAAQSIRSFDAQFIPALLQTDDYAAEVLALGDLPPDEAERLLLLHKERQRRFESGGMCLWAIVDEMAIRRPVGQREVLRSQLEHLRRTCQDPRVTVQVTQFPVVSHAPGSFSILRFTDDQMPDMVYVEHLTSAVYIDKRTEVDRYLLAMERLSVKSASPAATEKIITAILAGLNSTPSN